MSRHTVPATDMPDGVRRAFGRSSSTTGTITVDLVTYDTRIRDNDPRTSDRVLQVTRLEGCYVFAKACSGRPGKVVRIKRVRIHTDGKPRKSGWNVVA